MKIIKGTVIILAVISVILMSGTEIYSESKAEYKTGDSLREYEKYRFTARTLDILCPDSGYLTRVALAGVIIRRTSMPIFSVNVTEAVFSDGFMSEAHLGDYSKEPTELSMHAVRDAYLGLSPCPEALWFYRISDASGAVKTKRILYKSGDYAFA